MAAWNHLIIWEKWRNWKLISAIQLGMAHYRLKFGGHEVLIITTCISFLGLHSIVKMLACLVTALLLWWDAKHLFSDQKIFCTAVFGPFLLVHIAHALLAREILFCVVVLSRMYAQNLEYWLTSLPAHFFKQKDEWCEMYILGCRLSSRLDGHSVWFRSTFKDHQLWGTVHAGSVVVSLIFGKEY
jgi:hypothetical protein